MLLMCDKCEAGVKTDNLYLVQTSKRDLLLCKYHRDTIKGKVIQHEKDSGIPECKGERQG